MAARLTASLISLVVLLTAAIPAVAGYRCVVTGARMEAASSCCRQEVEQTSFKAQCCEELAAPRLEPRRTQPSPEKSIQAPTIVAWVLYPATAPMLSATDLTTPARARGRPPGEQLQLLSTILRV
jgi:hypothetical protein